MDEVLGNAIETWEAERDLVKDALHEVLQRTGGKPGPLDAIKVAELKRDIARLEGHIAWASAEQNSAPLDRQ